LRAAERVDGIPGWVGGGSTPYPVRRDASVRRRRLDVMPRFVVGVAPQ
jgi:hypothetical protein